MSGSQPISFAVWRGQHTSPGDLERAIEVLNEQLGPQLDWPITVKKKQALTLPNAPYDSYAEYLELFQQEAELEEGHINICLYNYSVIKNALQPILSKFGIGEYDQSGNEAKPFAGFAPQHFSSDKKSPVIVNTSMKLNGLPKSLFENFLIHEALHPVLNDDHAPVPGEDHSFGSTHLGQASPMLTGYSEIIPMNPRPKAECHDDSVSRTVFHTPELSECTKNEVKRYMEEDFS